MYILLLVGYSRCKKKKKSWVHHSDTTKKFNAEHQQKDSKKTESENTCTNT